MISIIQRYLAKEWIKWFCLSVFFLISLLSLQLIAEDLDSVYDWESTIQELGISTIAYIPWIFPIACFVATLLTISFLTMRGEMLGIQACSLSWVHCFTPICLIGCFVSFVSWFVMKWETEFLDFVNHDYSKQVESSFFRMKIGSDRLWYFENFDFQKIVGKKVHFYAYDANGNDAYRIRASLAFWSEGREWIFEDGQFIGFASLDGLPIYDTSMEKIVWEREKTRSSNKIGKLSPGFSKQFEVLHLPKEMDDPSVHMLIANKPNMLSYGSLEKILKEYPNSKESSLLPFKYRFFQMNWNSLSCLIAVLCALMIGIGNARQSMSRIATITIIGMLGFYLLRTFFDSLGDNGIFNPFLNAGLPYVIAATTCLAYAILFQRKLS